MPADTRQTQIDQTLRDQLAATHVQVIDESHLHVGHAGAASGGGHYRAVIVADGFEGKTSVERQRMVYAALGDLMRSEIHALSMQTLTPAQWRDAQSEPSP
jgi:BolA protein